MIRMSGWCLLLGTGVVCAQNFPVELRVNSSVFGSPSTQAHPSNVTTGFVNVPVGTDWVDMRLQLPPGVQFVDQVPTGALPQLPTTCTSTAQADGGTLVNCRSTGITAATRQHFSSFRLALPDPDLLPEDGTFQITYSVHIPGHDPDFDNCDDTGGRIFVGCAVLAHQATPQLWTPRAFRQAEQPQQGSATWGTPMRVGKRGLLGVDWNYGGNVMPGAPATAWLLLPPGVQYTPAGNLPIAAGVSCDSDGVLGERELLACTIHAVNMTTHAMIQPLVLTLGRDVAIGNNGTVPFHGVIDIGHQPMPDDWFDNPAQDCTACYTLHVPVLGPRLQISTVMPLPSETWVVGGPYAFDIWLRNNELSGQSGNLHLHAQLPPGMHYQSHESHGWPVADCQSQPGSEGDVLICSWTTPMGAQDNRRIVINVGTDDALDAPGPVPVLFALEEHATATPADELARCSANPDVPDCFLLHRPTVYLCASQHADGIFCDGFQVFMRPER